MTSIKKWKRGVINRQRIPAHPYFPKPFSVLGGEEIYLSANHSAALDVFTGIEERYPSARRDQTIKKIICKKLRNFPSSFPRFFLSFLQHNINYKTSFLPAEVEEAPESAPRAEAVAGTKKRRELGATRCFNLHLRMGVSSM